MNYFASDSSKAFASYKFDKKGKLVYEKSIQPASEKSYYTVYTYDKKGKKSDATERFEDGTFKKRIKYTWLKDSIRIEDHYLNPKDSMQLSVKYWGGPEPKNVVRKSIWYMSDGSVRFEMGGIFDKNGKSIGSYDSTVDSHSVNEIIYYKHMRKSTYRRDGPLYGQRIVTLDSTGYVNGLIKTSPGENTYVKYTIVQRIELVIVKNGVALTESERAA